MECLEFNLVSLGGKWYIHKLKNIIYLCFAKSSAMVLRKKL